MFIQPSKESYNLNPSTNFPTSKSSSLFHSNGLPSNGPQQQPQSFKYALLNVQLDALAALVDEQATRRLWKVFTNCAGSIAHGRRLENLSWRSWGRDQSILHQSHNHVDNPLYVRNQSPNDKWSASNGTSHQQWLQQQRQQQEQQAPVLTTNTDDLEHRSYQVVADLPVVPIPGQGHRQPAAAAGALPPRISSVATVTSPTRPLNRTDGGQQNGTRSISVAPITSTSISPTTTTTTTTKLAFPLFDARSHSANTSTSTSTLVSLPPQRPSLTPRNNNSSFVVSRSPPLGPLIKRVIFTPQSTDDDAARALDSLMTSCDSRTWRPSGKEMNTLSEKPGQQVQNHHPHYQHQHHDESIPSSQLPKQQPAFPTVVILESTPKPTPPDTPARGLSPTEPAHFRPIFHFQTLAPPPLHAALAAAATASASAASSEHQPGLSTAPSLNFQPSPSSSPDHPSAPRKTPMVPIPISESSLLSSPPNHNAPAAAIEKFDMVSSAPSPSGQAVAANSSREAQPYSLNTRRRAGDEEDGKMETSSIAVAHSLSLLHPDPDHHENQQQIFPAGVNKENETGTVGAASVMTSHPTRMFFLQRDSSSLSPDSNSRSGSHSRSPDSRSPGARSPSPARNGESSKINEGKEEDIREISEDLQRGTKMGRGLEAPEQKMVAAAKPIVARELVNETAHQQRDRPSPPPTEEQPNSNNNNMSIAHPSSSSSSQTHPSRQQRLVMRSKKGGYRPHFGGRPHDRPSSRASNREGSLGGVGSRGSASVSSNTAAGGEANANAGSAASASGMGSMSTSAGSKLVMKRHPRTHSPLGGGIIRTLDGSAPTPPPVSKERVERVASPATRLPAAGAGAGVSGSASASASGQPHAGQRPPHVSPLAVLPEPLRMEVLERQVMQSAMKNQSAGRKISLESDSEDDYTDDDDQAEDTDDDEEIVVTKGQKESAGKAPREVVEEEDGSSWSDEETGEDEVVVAKKRPQTQQHQHQQQQQKQPGPAQPPSRRGSRDLDHLVGSATSGRQVAHPHGPVKPLIRLPHVRSKGKIAQHHGHHHAHGNNAAQRANQHSPPPRPAVARKGSAGHTKSAPSQDGPLAQAAREALRQRDMFTPLPRERYSSTNLVREKSRTSLSRGGRPSNLTMRLNPDPQWFPQNHPYRQDVHPMDQKLSRSMEELYARGNGSGVKSPRLGTGLGFGGLKMTTTAQPTPSRPVAPTPAKSTSPDKPGPSKRATAGLSKSPPPPTKLRPSKSAVAVPVVLGVTASSTPRDEKQADVLEMSLRQMGPQRPRPPRQAPEPSRVQSTLPGKQGSEQSDGRGTPSRPSNRLSAKPTDVEFSDTEDEAPASPPPKVAGNSGRSLAKEHLEAVMGGKVKAGMSASRTVVASPDAPKETDSTSYRPPAPPSSPSAYNPYEPKRAQGQLPHTPPSSRRTPAARAPRTRPHSSHGQPTAPVVSPTPPSTAVQPQRERRQPATSQPPIPVTTQPLPSAVPWPYNLPYPAPLQSPRTTRLNMLASEVPDDLRKDLLWERKTNRIAPILDNRATTPLAPPRRNAAGLKPMTNITSGGGGGVEGDEESEQARQEREAKERYDKMRTQTWNGVIYQRPVW